MKMTDLNKEHREFAESLVRMGDSEDLAIRTTVEHFNRIEGRDNWLYRRAAE